MNTSKNLKRADRRVNLPRQPHVPSPPSASVCSIILEAKMFEPLKDIQEELRKADLLANHLEGMKSCAECDRYVPEEELEYNEDLWHSGICDRCASRYSDEQWEDMHPDYDNYKGEI